jgi:anthranilate synthase component 2
MLIMIDNYDSFTYNLVQYIQQMDAAIQVFRNDADDLARNWKRWRLRGHRDITGPRPTGQCRHILANRAPAVAVGFRCSVSVLGFTRPSPRPWAAGWFRPGGSCTAKPPPSPPTGKGFSGVSRSPSRPCATTPWPWIAIRLPEELIVTALAEDGEIMGLRHRHHPTEGVQFHPESIMTPVGKRLLRNFLSLTRNAIGETGGESA